MPYALCLKRRMPYALCPLPHAECLMEGSAPSARPYDLCLMPSTLCLLSYTARGGGKHARGGRERVSDVLCLMPYALCLMHTLTQRVEEASMREVEGSAHSRRRRQLEILAGRCVRHKAQGIRHKA